MSGPFFFVIMQSAFRPLKQRWNLLNARRSRQYYGVVVDRPDGSLTNLRFADEVLLGSSNRADVAKMLPGLQGDSRKYV